MAVAVSPSLTRHGSSVHCTTTLSPANRRSVGQSHPLSSVVKDQFPSPLGRFMCPTAQYRSLQ